jgi:hypothetical protein
MNSPDGAPSPDSLVEAPSPSEPDSADETIEHSFHDGRVIEVVTAAAPSGGFAILQIRVLSRDRRQWIRVGSGSFWSFETQTAAARHGRERAIFGITVQGI